MVEIYAKAEEVLIWMGLNNTPILESLHLEQLRYVEKLVVTTIVDLTDSSDLGDHTARYKTILVEPPESSVRIRGTLVAIFSHEWWTQIWGIKNWQFLRRQPLLLGFIHCVEHVPARLYDKIEMFGKIVPGVGYQMPRYVPKNAASSGS